MIGKELFASITMAGKLAHDYLGFAFMIGIALDVRDLGPAQYPEPRAT